MKRILGFQEGGLSSLTKAVALILEGRTTPVVTRYDLGVLVFDLLRQGNRLGLSVAGKRNALSSSEIVIEILDRLVKEGILSPHRSFPHEAVFSIFGRAKSPPEDVACAVDPFAYVSHLSAMEFHGLTDRIPNTIFLSSPSPREWGKFAQERMKSDLGDWIVTYKDGGLPLLTRITFRSILKRPVHVARSSHLGAFRTIKDRTFRVATIGRTFLDMVRSPELCGKMGHVLDVYKEYGRRYLTLIVDEVEAHGGMIDKVRVGYILEEYCGLSDARIQTWQSSVQRGGSRKLDPGEEYSPHFSKRWCLSLNVPMGDEK